MAFSLPEHRQPGVSFVIRARNEADALFRNFLSLRMVTVPHEVVLVLHRCTDASKKVAQAWQEQGVPIRLFEDQTPISRPGYETLITPADHPNSLPEFYRRSFSHARYNWLIKWDADFVITDYLVDFLSKAVHLDETRPMSYQLECMLGPQTRCHEEYMFNTCLGFDKYYCWEANRQVDPRESIRLETPCMFSGSPVFVKEYWYEAPWFLQADTRDDVLAARYATLVEKLGPEPPGFARSNNPEFQPLWEKLVALMPELAQHGIYPDR